MRKGRARSSSVIKLGAAIIIWFGAFSNWSVSASQQIWQSDEMVLVFSEQIETVAMVVKAQYPAVRSELEQTFGWSLKVKPTIILIQHQADFQRIVPNPLFLAVAIPSRNTLIIDTSRVNAPPHNLRITLSHELAHLLLHQHIEDKNLPRWLDEGVCQWFTGGIAEVLLDRHRPMLGRALGSGEFIELADLDRSFPSERRDLMLAYEQSRDLVTFIATQYGTENLIGLLNRLRQGESVESSFYLQLDITIEELEKIWQRKLTGGVMWWGRLANNIYGILFFLAALLTVVGFAFRIIRRRQRWSDEEEEADFE